MDTRHIPQDSNSFISEHESGEDEEAIISPAPGISPAQEVPAATQNINELFQELDHRNAKTLLVESAALSPKEREAGGDRQSVTGQHRNDQWLEQFEPNINMEQFHGDKEGQLFPGKACDIDQALMVPYKRKRVSYEKDMKGFPDTEHPLTLSQMAKQIEQERENSLLIDAENEEAIETQRIYYSEEFRRRIEGERVSRMTPKRQMHPYSHFNYSHQAQLEAAAMSPSRSFHTRAPPEIPANPGKSIRYQSKLKKRCLKGFNEPLSKEQIKGYLSQSIFEMQVMDISKEVRRWANAQFFQSWTERFLFREDQLQPLLRKTQILVPTGYYNRVTWYIVRSALGYPRRFSKRFLHLLRSQLNVHKKAISRLLCARSGEQVIIPKELHSQLGQIKRYNKDVWPKRTVEPGSKALVRSGNFIYNTTLITPPHRGKIKVSFGDGSVHIVQLADLCPLQELSVGGEDELASRSISEGKPKKIEEKTREHLALQQGLLQLRQVILERVKQLQEQNEPSTEHTMSELMQFYSFTSQILLQSQQEMKKNQENLDKLLGVAKQVEGKSNMTPLSMYSTLIKLALEKKVVSLSHLQKCQGKQEEGVKKLVDKLKELCE